MSFVGEAGSSASIMAFWLVFFNGVGPLFFPAFELLAVTHDYLLLGACLFKYFGSLASET